ncbi:hypothetical protein H0E87_017417 [Populus deltoides]|uniref:Uncharacterized protein n=1 Tax=Populus deltoides TaxID=3696 RepID=A0A8T2Y063_POPDE|nr:hypothetical protein H0E87_017417 [Populus deltoides]
MDFRKERECFGVVIMVALAPWKAKTLAMSIMGIWWPPPTNGKKNISTGGEFESIVAERMDLDEKLAGKGEREVWAENPALALIWKGTDIMPVGCDAGLRRLLEQEIDKLPSECTRNNELRDIHVEKRESCNINVDSRNDNPSMTQEFMLIFRWSFLSVEKL